MELLEIIKKALEDGVWLNNENKAKLVLERIKEDYKGFEDE